MHKILPGGDFGCCRRVWQVAKHGHVTPATPATPSPQTQTTNRTEAFDAGGLKSAFLGVFFPKVPLFSGENMLQLNVPDPIF